MINVVAHHFCYSNILQQTNQTYSVPSKVKYFKKAPPSRKPIPGPTIEKV